MSDDFKTSAKKCTTSVNVGGEFETQLPKRHEGQLKNAKEPNEELQLNIWGKVENKKVWTKPQVLLTVVNFDKRPFLKIGINPETNTVTTFLGSQFKKHVVPRTICTDNDTAFKSEEVRDWKFGAEFLPGLSYIHSTTGFVDTSPQTFKQIVLANLEDGLNMEETINRELRVLTLTEQTPGKFKSYKKHNSRELWTVNTNTLSTIAIMLSDWKNIRFSKSPTEKPLYKMRNGNWNLTNHIVIGKKKRSHWIEEIGKKILLEKSHHRIVSK